MERINIRCANCNGNDFDIEKCMLPKGIQLACKKCGLITPVAVFSRRVDETEILPVNGEASKELYDKAYCEDITYQEIFKAHRKDVASI